MKTVASICPYCGCGCRLLFGVENDRIVRMLPDKTDGPSEGIACIKGLTIHEVAYSGRILKPMLREDKNAPLREVSWKEAYSFIYERTRDLAPTEVFVNASGKVTTRMIM